jgi:hypothetical protein
MKKKILAIAISFGIAPVICFGNEQTDFMSNYITSLGFLAIGFERIEPTHNIKPEGQTLDALELLTNYRLAIHNCEMAEVLLKPYMTDSDRAINLSANTFSDGVEKLKHGLERAIDITNADIKKTHKGNNEPDPKDINEASQLGLDFQKSWDLIVMSAAAATHAVVEYPRKGKPGNLSMSEEERKGLLRQIDSSFPKLKTVMATKDDHSGIDTTASLVRDVLATFPTRNTLRLSKQRG